MNIPTSLKSASILLAALMIAFPLHQNVASLDDPPESKKEYFMEILAIFPGDEIDRDKHEIPRHDQWGEIPKSDYERVAWRIIEAFEQSDLDFNVHPGYSTTVGLLVRKDVRTDYTLRRVRAEIDELAGQVSKLLSQEAANELRRGYEPGTPLPDELRMDRTIYWRTLMRLRILTAIGEREDVERFRPFINVDDQSLSGDAAWYMESLDARLEGRYGPPAPGHTKKAYLPSARYEELKRQYESGEMTEKMRDWWERYE